MKTLIASMLIIASVASAQYVPVQYNTNTGAFAYGGTNGVTTNMQFGAANINVLTAGYVTYTNSYCEADFADGGTQDFTGAAGFEIITNFQVNVCHPMYTATSSNATINVTGWYRLYMSLSFSAGAASENTCRIYTNGAAAVTTSGNNLGWYRSTSAVGQNGVVAFDKLLYVTAGTIIDWRWQTGANETMTWKHGTVGIERK